MIKFEYIDIDKFIEKYKTTTPKDAQIKNFKKYYLSYIEERDKQEREGYQKNEINDLLKNTFGYKINEKDNIDSAIYDDNIVKVIIEAKQLKNKNEFPKDANNPLSKAFYESILYFLREYNQNNNNEIKHIIICNPIDFFVFCADEFKVFIEDKTIKRYYNNCDNKEGVDKSTSKFYKDLESHLKNNFDKTIKYTHFKLTKDIDDLLLSRIYQILSPEILLKKNKIIDANTLHKKFYDELLYILGLQEIKENGKILIKLSNTQNSLSNSIKNAFPNISDEEVFSLIILWNNRILFLRLLESMLISFGHIKEPFLDIEKINNFSTLSRLFFGVLAKKENDRNIDDKKLFHYIPYLNSSLFDKTKLELNGNDIKHLESYTIPLYQKSVLEEKELPLLEYIFRFLHTYDFTTTPKDIKDNIKINHDKLINSSILGLVFEKLNGYKEGSFYTPSFITSYMCKESITQAVLNKFNDTYNWNARGLKDISNLARENNKSQKELLQTLLSLKICDPSVGSGHFLVSALNEIVLIAYKIGLLESFNLKTTLRLENDEIVIKQDEDIFNYQKPNNKDEIQHKIQKELFHLKKEIIESCLFGVDINPNSCEITKLRLWIELLKYSYYIFDSKGENTNCLETLPNIDINIKEGNSLISNIPLESTQESIIKNLKNMINKKVDDDLFIHNNNEQTILSTINDIENKLPREMKKYKDNVNAYKNEIDKDLKRLQKKAIEKAKEFIINLFHKTSTQHYAFKSALYDYLQQYGYDGIDNAKIDNKSLDFEIKKLNDYITSFNFHKNKDLNDKMPNENVGYSIKSFLNLIDLMRQYETLRDDTSAFEWRFEFPEVLDESGDFKGFDLIIGNPPYGVNLTEFDKKKYREIYNSSSSDTAQLFIFLADKILSKNGINTFIVPKALTFATNWEQIRKFLKPNVSQIIDCGKAWSYVLLEMIIYLKQKNTPTSSYVTGFLNETQGFSQVLEVPKEYIDFFGFYPNDLSKEELKIGVRIREKFPHNLGDCGKNFRGDNFQKAVLKQGSISVLGGKEIRKYCIDGIKGYIKEKVKLTEKSKIQKNSILMQRLIAHIQNPAPHIKMMGTIIKPEKAKNLRIVDTVYQIVCNANIPNLYILGCLHSKFLNWYCYRFAFAKAIRTFQFSTETTMRIPIPQITESNQSTADKIIALVEKILEQKEKDPNSPTQELEKEIDSLVYILYGLSDDEIQIIKGEKNI